MEFIDFKRAVYKQFDALANNADRLYLTNVNKDELWDIWKENCITGWKESSIKVITLNIIDILKNGLLIYVPIKSRALEIK